jgi:hypothetical protein
MTMRSTACRLIVTLDADLVAWLVEESARRQREKSFMVQEVLARWRRRLEREREKRLFARCGGALVAESVSFAKGSSDG